MSASDFAPSRCPIGCPVSQADMSGRLAPQMTRARLVVEYETGDELVGVTSPKSCAGAGEKPRQISGQPNWPCRTCTRDQRFGPGLGAAPAAVLRNGHRSCMHPMSPVRPDAGPNLLYPPELPQRAYPTSQREGWASASARSSRSSLAALVLGSTAPEHDGLKSGRPSNSRAAAVHQSAFWDPVGTSTTGSLLCHRPPARSSRNVSCCHNLVTSPPDTSCGKCLGAPLQNSATTDRKPNMYPPEGSMNTDNCREHSAGPATSPARSFRIGWPQSAAIVETGSPISLAGHPSL